MGATQLEPAASAVVAAASLLRRLAEASDAQAFLEALRAGLPPLFPDTRVDLLRTGAGAERPALTVGDDHEQPEAVRDVSAHVAWLADRGFVSVSTHPLRAAGRQLGWLVVAPRDGPVEPELLAAAGQVAAAAALRILYDEAEAERAAAEVRAQLLGRRLRDAHDVRLRATLAAGAAHDVGNILASVLGHAQLMQLDAPRDLLPDILTIERAARDGHHLLRRMLTARATPAEEDDPPVALLPALISDALRLTQPFWETRPTVSVTLALAPVPPVRAHAAEVREVLVNLIMNGVAAMPEGGRLTVSTRLADDQVLAEVGDTGGGLSLEQASTIFEPLVTTRESGSGLGLAVSRAIAESYGGTLTVQSAPRAGATFVLSLPAAGELSAPSEVSPAGEWPSEESGGDQVAG